MKCREVVEILENAFPRKYALDWDPTGLQVGNTDREIKKIAIALDASVLNINFAIEQKADMLLTHHPMLFTPLKNVTNETLEGRKVISLIESGICCMAVHTNYDSCRMAQIAKERLNLYNTQVLEEVDDGKGIGVCGDLKKEMTLKECALFVKEKYNLPSIKYFGDENCRIKKAAVCPGSGKSVLPMAHNLGAQVMITGDIDHHTGLDQAENEMPIIDAGHYGLEYVFIEDMASFLRKSCPKAEVVCVPVQHPFVVL